MRIRIAVAGLAAAIALASPAMAADMPVKAMPVKAPVVADWSGLYLGGALGGAWTEVRGDYVTTPTLNHHDVNRSGWAGSVFVGAQYQWKQLLIGIEAGYSSIDNGWATSISGNPSCLATLANFTCRARVNDLFTVGPRLGVVLNNQWLLYGTGGYATARLNTSVLNAARLEVGRSGLNHEGYFAGAGFEYAVTPNWIVGAEYQHVWLDARRHFDDLFGGCCTVTPETRDMKAELDIARLRLSYKFNPMAPRP